FNGPNNATQRSPLPEQQDQCQTRKQDISGPLEWPRHNASPPVLEPLARHHAMLYCEQRQQTHVDGEGNCKWSTRSSVERSRHAEVADESDRVQKCREEDQVAQSSVGEECDSLKHSFVSMAGS